MSWIEAAPALLAALVVVLAPGAVALAPLRLGLVARAAASGLVSIACVGVAGLGAGALGISFALWQPFVPAVAIAALAWLVARRPTGARVPTERSGWRWVALTWLAASAVIGVVAFWGVSSPDRISQTYDNVFHMSAIASILDGGSASSLTLRTLIETDRAIGFYPAAWHALAATVAELSGSGAAVAVNATWLAVAGGVWLPGAAWLAQVLLPGWNPTTVALVALPVAASSAAMPYALLSWGTLYPTFLATALLPAALAVPILSARALMTRGAMRRWRATALGSGATLLAVAALAFAQPRVLATWGLLLAPAAVWALVALVRAAWTAGGAARRRAVWSLAAGGAALVLAAAAGMVYLITVLGLFDRPLEDRLGGPQAAASQSVPAGLWQVLSQSWPTGVGDAVSWPAVLLAVAVLCGIAVAVRARGVRWVVVSYVAVAVLFALAAGSDDVLTKLATGLWYKDRYRLSSALPVIGVALATLGILATARWLARRAGWRARGRVAVAVSAAWIVALTSAVALVAGGVSASIATIFRLPDTHAQSEVVSRAQMEFMARLPELVPAGQRVLGDPWDGSAWTQLLGDREPVFPHVNGQWDPDRLTLAWRLDAIETDPEVCAALRRLNVEHVLYSPHELDGGDPAGNMFPAPHRAVEAGLFTEVASAADTVLYRIDRCDR